MKTWRSILRRAIYGPLLIPQRGIHESGIWLAPVRLDLDDLEALRSLLGEQVGSQERSFLAAWQPGQVPDNTPYLLSSTINREVSPDEIPRLPSASRKSLVLVAFPDELDNQNRTSLDLSDEQPSTLHAGKGSAGSLNAFAVSVENYLEQRNVPRRMPYLRLRLVAWSVVAMAFLALAVWGVVSAWASSVPVALLMAALSALALYAVGNHALRTNTPYVPTERDTILIEQISRAEVDRKRRESLRYKITVGVALAAVAATAVISPILTAALRTGP